MASNGEDLIPVIQYVSGHDQRLDKVHRFYLEKTGHQPEYIIQTPGRVNIIGDHIDYHGFSVMPMAIEYSIVMACARSPNNNDNGDKIQLFNAQSNSFPNWSGSISICHERQPNLQSDPRWHSLFLCGYIGQLNSNILAYNEESGDNSNKINNINVAVYSDLPTAAGLSSSSSLVCASALATRLLLLHDSVSRRQEALSANCDNKANIFINKRQMAEECAKYERLIGTQGGGMDQAVIMTGSEGYAKYVEFMPELHCENVKLPLGVSFLISHSGVEYFKAATSGYNIRVLETKLAAAVISRHAGISSNVLRLDSDITLYKLKQCLGLTLGQMLIYIKEQVFKQKDIFTISEICKLLQFNHVDQLLNEFQASNNVANEINNGFKLRSRCVHVIEEAMRVEKFKSICETTSDIRMLGEIMTQSHESLRDLYECSHPSLDQIVETALKAGALGSRLTGAGWAGELLEAQSSIFSFY